MNYNISLAYEHCVVTVGIYDSPVQPQEEDELVEIAIDAISSDFPYLFPRHFHDVEIIQLPE